MNYSRYGTNKTEEARQSRLDHNEETSPSNPTQQGTEYVQVIVDLAMKKGLETWISQHILIIANSQMRMLMMRKRRPQIRLLESSLPLKGGFGEPGGVL